MKLRHLHLILLITLAGFLIAACNANNNNSAPANNSAAATDRVNRTASDNANTSPSAEAVHPLFAVTADQVRSAFDEYKLKGEKKQKITVGEEQAASVTVVNQLGQKENLRLTILFLPPLEQGKLKGYTVGRDANPHNPLDPTDKERWINDIVKSRDVVAFRVFLQQPKDDDSAIPPISYFLVGNSGERVAPTKQPSTYISTGPDLIGAVALAENGEELTFPGSNSTPHLTSKMDKFTLIVDVDGKEQKLEYHLK